MVPMNSPTRRKPNIARTLLVASDESGIGIWRDQEPAPFQAAHVLPVSGIEMWRDDFPARQGGLLLP